MRISNLDLSETEVEKLQSLAKEKGHDVAVLSPANLVRAALGFDLRNRGGARHRPAPSGEAETGQRGGRKTQGSPGTPPLRRRR